jgi:DNA-binding transcriptional regulator YiaG
MIAIKQLIEEDLHRKVDIVRLRDKKLLTQPHIEWKEIKGIRDNTF